MIIFGLSSQPLLAKKISELTSSTLGEVQISQFPNGEKRLQVTTSVSDQEVVILQSLSNPVDSNTIELVLMADALERAGAKHVTAVIPWLGYSLQDKVFRSGEPLAARVIADILSHAFIHKILLLDMHNPSIAGFFSKPSEHLRALPLYVEYVQKNFDCSNCVVVSPDFGGIKQAQVFADALQLTTASINKHRDLHTGKVQTVGIAGEVKNKICLVYDDVINTGSTVGEVAKFLKENGAKEVHFLVTHALLAGKAKEMLEHEAIDSVVITDSVFHDELPKKVKVISIAELVAERLGIRG